MGNSGSARDSALLDALEALSPVSYKDLVWRVVREGRDPCDCAATGGRWDDRTFDVLYTSQLADGAVAEMSFHVHRGQPVAPSKVRYHLHELRASLNHALKLADLVALEMLWMDASRYGQLSYAERPLEYPRSQEVAEAAHFLGFEGLIVPSAQWDCHNVVLFCDTLPPEAREAVRDHGPVDWSHWKKQPYGY